MSFFANIKQKVFSLAKLEKRDFDPEKMSIEDISLPYILQDIDKSIAKATIKEELKTFKSLGYKNQSADELENKLEYHSYQIGLILRCLKDEVLQLNSTIKDILPKKATYITKQQLHIKVFNIVYKYDNLINKKSTKQELEENIAWTPLEMAYLLYYLSLENRTI
jgi:hypothetical protein